MATLNIKNFPDGLHRRLQARAKQHRRSVAQEVTHILAAIVDGGAAATAPARPTRRGRPPAVDAGEGPVEAGGYIGRDSGWD